MRKDVVVWMVQLFWNETFYRRISPTSFYSMMAKAPTDDQATKMVNNWLHSPEHFCIAPNGDFAGNKDTCYWGLPSIEASDPAFPPLGYWRGYVWCAASHPSGIVIFVWVLLLDCWSCFQGPDGPAYVSHTPDVYRV